VPSTETVIDWLLLSMAITTLANDGVATGSANAAARSEAGRTV
jgi:hypothetical protein